MPELEEYLRLMDRSNASDLFLKAGSPPYLRIDGRLCAQSDGRLSPEAVQRLADRLMTEEQRVHFAKEHEMDLAIGIPNLGRFRVNIFTQRGTQGIVIRQIRSEIHTFEELGLPVQVMEQLSMESRGLVLITGRTGSGKSTTIASMLDYMNRNVAKHIVTLEDPIEYLHEDRQCIISQREVPFDTRSYHGALKHVMRQSPDVIFIGDIRDTETMEAALAVGESGHLVLSELHTTNTVQTIERIINFFPPHLHQEVRLRLSFLLKGVVAMRLVARKEGTGRVPACEIMVLTPTIRDLIREGRLERIREFIQDGALYRMETFNQALIRFCREGIISVEEARNNADGLEEFDLGLKSIRVGREAHTRPPSQGVW